MSGNNVGLVIVAAIIGIFRSGDGQAADEVVDNHIPDFYQEPGASGSRSYAFGPDGTETIDPFSGMLCLNYTDLVAPGNGGMGINVVRNYQNVQGVPGLLGMLLLTGVNSTGINWTIHFGRVLSHMLIQLPTELCLLNDRGVPANNIKTTTVAGDVIYQVSEPTGASLGQLIRSQQADPRLQATA